MRTVWFGTRGYESWVKEHRPDFESPYVGHANRNDQINGGVSVIASGAGHREYAMEWNGTIDEMDTIQATLDGLYDTPDNRGLIYFIDQAAATRNLFPRLWAAPFLCGVGAPSLSKGIRPALATTPANTFGLPARTATFTVDAATPLLEFYAPIPSGWRAEWAFYGPTAQTGKITVTPYVAGAAGATSVADVLANTGYGTGATVSTGVDGLGFTLTPNAGAVTLTAALLRMAPVGVPLPSAPRFRPGDGHSGCRVDGAVSRVVTNANPEINWAKLSVRLVEVGSWL